MRWARRASGAAREMGGSGAARCALRSLTHHAPVPDERVVCDGVDEHLVQARDLERGGRGWGVGLGAAIARPRRAAGSPFPSSSPAPRAPHRTRSLQKGPPRPSRRRRSARPPRRAGRRRRPAGRTPRPPGGRGRQWRWAWGADWVESGGREGRPSPTPAHTPARPRRRAPPPAAAPHTKRPRRPVVGARKGARRVRAAPLMVGPFQQSAE